MRLQFSRLAIGTALLIGLSGCGADSSDNNSTNNTNTNADTDTDTNNTDTNNTDTNNTNNTSAETFQRSGTVSEDATWSGTNVIESGLEINAVITIEACTTVELGPDALVHVRDGGAIVANGTADCPVTFTSSKSSPAEGDWERLDLWASSSNETSFTHTVFEYGGGDAGWGMLWVESGARVALSDVTFRDSEGRAAYFEAGAKLQGFANVSLENLGQEAFFIGANEVGSLTPMQIGDNVPPIEVAASTVEDDQTWRPVGLPYVVSDLKINAALEIAAGTELMMVPDALHHVRDGGTLVASGEEGNPVIFSSSKSSPAAGDWERFDIWATAGNNNSLTWTEIKYGGRDTRYGAIWVEEGATLNLENSTFSDNDGCDVYDKGMVNATVSDYVSCL